MRDWLGGIATRISQGLNCWLLKGNPDMTVSARCHLNQDLPRWRTARKIINRLFFWQDDHCKSSFRSDVVYAVWVLTQAEDGRIASDNTIVGQDECSQPQASKARA